MFSWVDKILNFFVSSHIMIPGFGKVKRNDEKEFLKGAQNFFEMVIDCFVKGNLKNLLNFIDSKLIKSFQSVIDERLVEQESLKIDIVKINSIQIKDVKKLRNFLRLSEIRKSRP